MASAAKGVVTVTPRRVPLKILPAAIEDSTMKTASGAKEMTVERYIVWSKERLDPSDPWQRRWFIKQVLVHGRSEDIAALDWEKIRKLLPQLDLPSEFRRLWEEYFANECAQA